ncbi:MAG: hypothetical protein ACK56I_00050, partial [bacterium]
AACNKPCTRSVGRLTGWLRRSLPPVSAWRFRRGVLGAAGTIRLSIDTEVGSPASHRRARGWRRGFLLSSEFPVALKGLPVGGVFGIDEPRGCGDVAGESVEWRDR